MRRGAPKVIAARPVREMLDALGDDHPGYLGRNSPVLDRFAAYSHARGWAGRPTRSCSPEFPMATGTGQVAGYVI